MITASFVISLSITGLCVLRRSIFWQCLIQPSLSLLLDPLVSCISNLLLFLFLLSSGVTSILSWLSLCQPSLMRLDQHLTFTDLWSKACCHLLFILFPHLLSFLLLRFFSLLTLCCFVYVVGNPAQNRLCKPVGLSLLLIIGDLLLLPRGCIVLITRLSLTCSIRPLACFQSSLTLHINRDHLRLLALVDNLLIISGSATTTSSNFLISAHCWRFFLSRGGRRLFCHGLFTHGVRNS